MPAASYGLVPNMKKYHQICFFSSRDRSIIFVKYFVHTNQRSIVLYDTPGQRPPHITGHCVNTVNLGWARASDERTPFRIHGAVVGFVDQSMPVEDSESRRFDLNIRLGCSEADLGPTSTPKLFCSGICKTLERPT